MSSILSYPPLPRYFRVAVLAKLLFEAGFDEANGTPTVSVSNTKTGISVTGVGNGFTFTVPAGTTSRTLKVYVGVGQAQGKFTASLSDKSAADYSDSSLDETNSGSSSNATNSMTNRVYTLTYTAGSDGQTLTVTLITQSGSGNVTLQAATLFDGSSHGSGSSLTGTIDPPASTVNLTSEGTIDWAHWGLNTENSFDQKSSGGSKISNYSLVGSGTVCHYALNPNGYTWIDGTPGNKFPKDKELGQRILGFTQPERNSYRVERASEDEALHKVHIETDILWPRKWPRWSPIKPWRKMKCYLTYELLFHRPSKAQHYVLRELRFVSTYGRILSTQELGDLKRVAIEKFINCWLEKNFKIGDDHTEEPLLALSPRITKPTY